MAVEDSLPFIVETIVTTVDPAGELNVAPMGVTWPDAIVAGSSPPASATAAQEASGGDLVLQPYRNTTTYRNFAATGEGVVNLTDDVRLFARAAISDPTFDTQPARVVRGRVLDAACSWREVKVTEVEGSAERSRFVAKVAHHGFHREFIGFNRARNAVLEAAILATRVRFLPREEILGGLQRLRVIVDKTAGRAEREAMDLLTAHVEKALGGVG